MRTTTSWASSSCVIASVSWAFGSVASKVWLTPPKDPFVASAYQMVFGGIGCAVAAALHGEHFHPGAVTGTSVVGDAFISSARDRSWRSRPMCGF